MSEDRQHAGEMAQDMLADLIQKLDPGAMLTRFVGIVEVVDADGDRCVWTLVTPGATAWDSLGLMEYGKAIEYAALACTHE